MVRVISLSVPTPLFDPPPVRIPIATSNVENARQQYKAEVKLRRHDVMREADKALIATSGDPWTRMNYVYEPKSGLPKIVFRSGVYPKGWRVQGLEFQAPGHYSSRRKLELIVNGLRAGTMRFEPVDPAEVELIVEYFQIDWAEACAAGNYSTAVRDLRPLDTRSGRLRKGTTNKTAQEVDDPEDLVEDEVWPADVARAMYKMMDMGNVRI